MKYILLAILLFVGAAFVYVIWTNFKAYIITALVIIILAWIAYLVYPAIKRRNAAKKQESTLDDIIPRADSEISTLDIQNQKIVEPQQSADTANVSAASVITESPSAAKEPCEFRNYEVKGVFAHEDDIFHKIMERNSTFDYSRRDLIDLYYADQKIYKWVPKNLTAKLIPEDDNQYDSNAVRIDVGGIPIGYIPRGKCNEVRELIRSGKIDNIAYEITGGSYKLLAEDYDCIKDKSTYTMETGRDELAATITIRIRE